MSSLDIPPITISQDGYVRLMFDALLKVPLIHLLSGLDEDAPTFFSDGAIQAAITGYTEWVSTTTPAISMGWDWQLSASQGRTYCSRMGEPRSNIMLVNTYQQDIGVMKTTTLLITAVDKLDWQDQVMESINTRYAR